MELVFDTLTLNIPQWIVILAGVAVAFLITYISIPTIITVAHKLNLYERELERGSHDGHVPTLGGVAIFAGLVITGALFANQQLVQEFQYILGALVVLFFTGIKDDLLIMDPRKKLVAQILAALLIVVMGDLRITNFHGFVNIHEISYVASVLFTVFVFIVIINGFNLIDGIDGLASGVAILVSVTFGIWFVLAGYFEFSVVPFGLAGSLLAFFRFNVFSTKNKIFLGDTGSLIIGLIVAVIAVKFLQVPHDPASEYSIFAAPAVAFSILIVPLFDTLRVFILRIFGGESPFHPDRKHIHHRMLDLGCSHLCASGIILAVNGLFIALAFILQDWANLKLIMLTFALASGLSYIPVYKINRREKRATERLS